MVAHAQDVIKQAEKIIKQRDENQSKRRALVAKGGSAAQLFLLATSDELAHVTSLANGLINFFFPSSTYLISDVALELMGPKMRSTMSQAGLDIAKSVSNGAGKQRPIMTIERAASMAGCPQSYLALSHPQSRSYGDSKIRNDETD